LQGYETASPGSSAKSYRLPNFQRYGTGFSIHGRFVSQLSIHSKFIPHGTPEFAAGKLIIERDLET
jgi:hypothetical protein